MKELLTDEEAMNELVARFGAYERAKRDAKKASKIAGKQAEKETYARLWAKALEDFGGEDLYVAVYLALGDRMGEILSQAAQDERRTKEAKVVPPWEQPPTTVPTDRKVTP